MRHVLVGEAPGRDSIAGRPQLALTGASGQTLARYLEVPWPAFLRRTMRLNLFYDPQDPWRPEEARAAADSMLAVGFRRCAVVLLGVKVAAAFGTASWPLYEWNSLSGGIAARAPHPSGRDRLLNDPAERERYAEFLREWWRA